MGSLRFFNLAELKQRYNTPHFIETGLGRGDGVKYAQTVSFERIFSVEIMPEQVYAFRPQFTWDTRVQIICSDSISGLKAIFAQYPQPAIIWADSHFPGADLGIRGFADEQNEDIRLPLITELELIRDERAAKGIKDVILMDDLMIFDEVNHYPGEDWKAKLDIKPRKHVNARDKILSILSATHTNEVFNDDNGFVIFSPK